MSRFPALSQANLASSAALSRSRTTTRTIAYWATTTLVAAEMGLGGVWDVLRTPQVRGVIERLGYPTYFLVILGVWKLLGAVALLAPRAPRLKEWAYAGAVFNYTGAVASNLAAGEADAGTLVLLIALTGLTAASWALRPPARRGLAGPARGRGVSMVEEGRP
jgi:uncharacterized membrane protein YphA (DoxX/SURF4 family)